MTDDAAEILRALLLAFAAQGFDSAVARIGGEWVAADLPAEPAEINEPFLRQQFALALEVIEADIALQLIISADLTETWPNGFTLVGPFDDGRESEPNENERQSARRSVGSDSQSERFRATAQQILNLTETLRLEQRLDSNTQGDR